MLNAVQTPPTTEQRLATLKTRVSKAKEERAKAEATLESLQAQEREILDELNELGVAPEDLDAEIARLDKEIAASLDEAEQLLGGTGE